MNLNSFLSSDKVHILNRKDIFIAFLIFIISLILYMRTLAPGLLYGDGAEFQVLCYILAPTHSTGYPIYLLIGKIFTFIPIGNIAYRINLMSAFFGALSIGLFYLLGKLLTNRIIPSITGAFLAGINHLFWWQAIMAEIYTMSTAFFLTILLLIILWNRNKNYLLLFFAGLTGGLGLGVHGILIFIIPAAMIYLMINTNRWLDWIAAILGIIIGFLIMFVSFALIEKSDSPANYFHVTLNHVLIFFKMTPAMFDTVFERWYFLFSGKQFYRYLSPENFSNNLNFFIGYLIFTQRILGILLMITGFLFFSRKRWRENILLTPTFLILLISALFYTVPDYYVFFILPVFILLLFLVYGIASCQLVIAKLINKMQQHFSGISKQAEISAGTFILIIIVLLNISDVSTSFLSGKISFAKDHKEMGITDYPYPVLTPNRPREEAEFILNKMENNAVLFTDWKMLYTLCYIAYIDKEHLQMDFYEIYPPPADDFIKKYIIENLKKRPIYILSEHEQLLSELKKLFHTKTVSKNFIKIH